VSASRPRPAAGLDGAGLPAVKARPRKRRAGNAARRDEEAELAAHVKRVVDALPLLTEEQRDLLVLIFRSSSHRIWLPS